MSDKTTIGDAATRARKDWLAVLARADREDLENAWEALSRKPDYEMLRKPESGLVMVRGRAGGNGRRFNLGEMSVTRCVVGLADGTMGVGYVPGRDHRKAELVALFDGLLAEGDMQATLMAELVEPLRATQVERRAVAGRRAAATRVDFFTLVRGDNPE
ncbi:phosphonate C-P lyase system protein PhnG [Oceanibacterium hippocampi]|uniref:Alpha-D-ribose 1-methylphosphonate 5-triphosphate synthase subunit PhnG n=1 Tax=Oceanibacterium hippocampi TaxID=745714 RepID=A0A1Y5TXX5_9PROT|nr:phosphonate C-P lyase system protein PhnG [Oceanibacterium hippocampi]SLN76107.1 Alpha-D-ribose 1-methylphosphonate 5-triphosphate synthase subunit PhnG [Oceanibacterium hippocampi]